jgi:hypothetical protein
MLEDNESKDVFNWFLKFRIAYAIIGLDAEEIFPYLDFYKNKNRNIVRKTNSLCVIDK